MGKAASRGIENIVRHHLRVAPGEKALILHRGVPAIVAAVARAIREAGAQAEVTLIESLEEGHFATRLRHAVRDVDVATFLSADEGESARGALIVSTMEETKVRYLHATGLSERALASTLRAHPEQLRAINQRLIDQLASGGELELRSPAGSELRLRLDPRYPLVRYEGVPEPGRWESVPTGAVSVHPADIEGTYVVDRLLKAGSLERSGRQLQRSPLTLHIDRGRLVGLECDDGELVAKLRERLDEDPNASVLGFVSIATNPLCLNELGSFSNDALLPGLRLMFGYSDPKKTGAPRSSPHWTTVLGRRHDLKHDGTPIVTAGRLDRRWTD